MRLDSNWGMIMPARLIDYFNKQPRIGLLSTANKEGKVNAACLWLADDD